MQRSFQFAATCTLAALLIFSACAANPIDAGLNAVEAGINTLEQEVRGLQGKLLPADASRGLEEKAAVLRKAYAEVVRSDPAAMTKEQETRWSDLRKRSIDVITDMMNLLAQATPN